jgi:hypothetical protein
MSRRVLTSLVAVCATVCIMTPSVAHAANTTCANADYIFLGERAQYTIGASANLYFKTNVTAGRSYAVIAWGPFTDVGEGGVSLSVDLYNNSTCTTTYPGTNTNDYEPLVFGIAGHSGDHDSVIPTTDGVLYISVGNGIASAYTTHVLVIETTLFSPWWFTSGNNNAFVELRNNMNSATTAQLTFYRSTGDVCATTTVPLAANGNAALSIGALGTCAGGSGSSQIAFPGTPGGIIANTTTIDPVNGTSFDSPFAPRMVWSTFSR